jgi:uncharacterized coiled-coil DUF342 family protein
MNHSNLTAAVDNIIELNERLTAMTKQRDGIEAKLRIELRGHPDSELWGDAGLITATMRCVDAHDEAIEQRDEARKEVAELKEEYGTWWAQKRIALDELKDVTAQRDKLAEALEQLMTYQPRSTVIAMNEHHVWRDAKEALQSLTPNAKP